MAFELSERHKNGLKSAILDMKTEDRVEFGKVMLSTILEDCSTLCDEEGESPEKAEAAIRAYCKSLDLTDAEIDEFLEDARGVSETDYTTPRILADFGATIINALLRYAGDDAEKVDHEDNGDTEVLTFAFSNGKTFQIQISEVEEVGPEIEIDPSLN